MGLSGRGRSQAGGPCPVPFGRPCGNCLFGRLDKEMKMKTHSFRAGSDVWFGLALFALLAGTVLPQATFGADRVVLGEEFTNTG